MLQEVVDFFNNAIEFINKPGVYLADAADSLNEFSASDNILVDYFGYIHYGMGTPLYMAFCAFALIGIAVNMFNIVTNVIRRFLEICGR